MEKIINKGVIKTIKIIDMDKLIGIFLKVFLKIKIKQIKIPLITPSIDALEPVKKIFGSNKIKDK